MASHRFSMACAFVVVVSLLAGCEVFSPKDAGGGATGTSTFDGIVKLLEKHADAVVLEGDGGSKVVVSPALQGRLMTLKVGAVESTGLVNAAAVLNGEADPQFNNYGGADRFWIGPEGGPFGIYFAPGDPFDRTVWKVPAGFDKGPFQVVSKDAGKIVMSRDMEVMNYSGTKFKVHVDREVGIIKADALSAELGVNLPEDVRFVGAYSVNTLANAGDTQWKKQGGLIGVWILGQFNPSDSAVIIGPFRPGADTDLGPRFNDDYFGKVSVEAPERLKVVGNTVVFRADSKRVGKFGISQQRSTGLAGSIDFERKLLTIVKFDVPSVPEMYANSTWVKNQAEPFKGDVLQSWNNGVQDKPGELAEVPFYELESTSPVRELAPKEALRHRHATFHFQGDLQKLAPIARQLLGVELQAVKDAILK